jgi:hypothetical protein
VFAVNAESNDLDRRQRPASSCAVTVSIAFLPLTAGLTNALKVGPNGNFVRHGSKLAHRGSTCTWPSRSFEREDRETDRQCSAANAKELVEIERDDLRTIAKKPGESRPELVSSRRGCLGLRQMYDDPERPIHRQPSRPTNNELLRFPVQIPFTERKGVGCIKELGDIFDPYFDRIWRRCRFFTAFIRICNPIDRGSNGLSKTCRYCRQRRLIIG